MLWLTSNKKYESDHLQFAYTNSWVNSVNFVCELKKVISLIINQFQPMFVEFNYDFQDDYIVYLNVQDGFWQFDKSVQCRCIMFGYNTEHNRDWSISYNQSTINTEVQLQSSHCIQPICTNSRKHIIIITTQSNTAHVCTLWTDTCRPWNYTVNHKMSTFISTTPFANVDRL